MVLSAFDASLNPSLLKWELVTKAEAARVIDGQHGYESYTTIPAPTAETLVNWKTVALYTPTISYGKQIVEFYLGANKIELSEVSGVNINGEVVEDAEVSIEGNPEGENFELTRVRYRLLAGSDIYIAPGTGLREQLDEPEGMLTPFWDIRYEGLTDTGITIIRFDAAGDDEYNLEFTNQEGIMYDIPLMSNKISAVDLDMLKGGQIATDDGSTEYNQYLKLGSGRIIFAEDERDKAGYYLYFEAGLPIFEWELEFEEGLESEISGFGNTKDLADLEDEDINVLGQPFIIADTDLNDDNQLTIELMSGATGGILGENDKEIYAINGKEYEVEVIAISETAAGGEGSVKFRINGEITDELEDGETDVLADGTQIGVIDILATGKDIQKSIANLETIKDLYNTNLQKVPVISSLFRNERVNLYIEGNRSISLVTKDGEIETITEDLIEDQIVNVYTDIETIEKIIGEEITLSEALEEGAIRWEGVGFLNSLKFGVFRLFFNIYSFFSGLFQ